MHGFAALPDAFCKAGLQGVVQDVVSRLRVFENYNKQDLVRESYEDIRNGACARHDIFAIIGFKSS